MYTYKNIVQIDLYLKFKYKIDIYWLLNKK